MNNYKKFDEAIKNLNLNIRSLLTKLDNDIKSEIQEIRIRLNKPLIVNCGKQSYFITSNSIPTKICTEDLFISTQKDIIESFQNICDYSIYSFQEQLKEGYITINGGHRIGICGTAVISNSVITSVKNISSLNVRIAREINCASKNFLNNIENGSVGTLIVGPPSCGKTTLLRSIAKSLSDGSYKIMRKITVVDERNEIAGTYKGVSQNDLGFCDVLNAYPKAEGIMRAIRALSPEIIICDEIGSLDDIKAIKEGLNAGVVIIASIHAGSIAQFLKREQAQKLLKTGAFSKIVMMKDKNCPGCVEKIYEVGEKSVKSYRNYFDSFHRNDGGLYRIS